MKNEQKFYSALENIFIGEAGQNIEGKSGYVNLMKLKSQYFAQIKPFIEKEVNAVFGKMADEPAREEAFQKLYTFFESYLNETGTPFFSQTPFHKNLYEKVYSEREDVSLFWKTQRLYYVKSEANYHSLQNLEVDGMTFNFDASQIEHQKNNEKKSLEFWATELANDKVTFKVVYQDNSKSKWDRLKEYLELKTPDEIRKYLAENFGNTENPNIAYKSNGINPEGLKSKQFQNALLITNNDDLTKTVIVELAFSNLEDLDAWAKHNKIYGLTNREPQFKKAQQLYKKQNEVDYFIHKDAEGFLKEQLDMFFYQYLFGDRHLGNEWTQSRIENIQKLKRIAHKIIVYIARFEEELKHIWEKKKIVKQVNYVFTLDRLFPFNDKGERDFSDKKAIALIEKIIADKGFEKQIEEYKHLQVQWTDDKGEETKKEWKEFEKAAVLKKKDIFIIEEKKKKLNEEYMYLPIDIAFFPSLKLDFFSHFPNIEKQTDGILIKSDNWQALNTLNAKFESCPVDLVYIDPPFNTGSDFEYKDKYQDGTWLTLMDNRLALTKPIIKKEGNFFLHLDFNADYLGRLIADKHFGKDKLTNEIIWYYDNKIPDTRKKRFTNSFDIIFSYGNSENKIFNWLFTQREKAIKVSKMKKVDGKKIYVKDEFGVGIYQERTERTMDNVWKIALLHAQPEKFNGFATQKSEELLYRIIKSGSSIINNKKTTIVLDYYSGSGTTICTTHKLGGKWIGVEMGNHFYNLNLPRLKRVLVGDQSGISKNDDVNWKGGGFFKYYELEQYEECLSRASY